MSFSAFFHDHPRLAWVRILLHVEQVLAFVAIVVYAILAALNQSHAFGVILLSIFAVGNLVVPLAFLGRRVYVNRGEGALETEQRVMKQVSAFCNSNFRDDATLVVVALA